MVRIRVLKGKEARRAQRDLLRRLETDPKLVEEFEESFRQIDDGELITLEQAIASLPTDSTEFEESTS